MRWPLSQREVFTWKPVTGAWPTLSSGQSGAGFLKHGGKPCDIRVYGVSMLMHHVPGCTHASFNSVLPCASSTLMLTWKDEASDIALFVVRLFFFFLIIFLLIFEYSG